MKVMSFKLKSGEEVVARLMDSTSLHYTVDSPQTLQFQQVAPGQLGLAFVPWALSNPEITGVKINVEALLALPYPPSEKVEKQYLTQTSKIMLME